VQLVRSGLGAHDGEDPGALVQPGGEERPRIEAPQPVVRGIPAAFRRAAAVAIEPVHAHQAAHGPGCVGVGEQPSERPAALELHVHPRLRRPVVRGGEQHGSGQGLRQGRGAARAEHVPTGRLPRQLGHDAHGEAGIRLGRGEDEQLVCHA
jgi:hypothetical protein